MLPIATPAARYAFAGAALTMLLGSLTASWPIVSLGGSLLIGLSTCLILTMPLGRRVRRHRLEFAWWLAHAEPSSGGGAVIPGKPFEVRCFMRHSGGAPLLLDRLEPLVAAGVDGADGQTPDRIALRQNARTDFSFRLVAPAVGRVVIHGLAVTLPGPLGLFEVPLYFPNPLVIKVLPRAAHKRRGAARAATGSPVERSGASLLRPAGSGTELRELRELRPGDPFKSIAWKASARTGRLMIREVEQEVQETRYVILDVSGTMRGGAPGARKLDFAVEAAAAETRRALSVGDRVGLMTVDGRLLAHVPPSDARSQLLRVFEALLGAIEAVDEDLTELDDADVASVVGRYVRQQDGLDFGRGGRSRTLGWDAKGLTKHVHAALLDSTDKDPIRASGQAGELLRRFCRVRGIPLPYRTNPRDGDKGPGLAEALKLAAGRSRVPMAISVLTDGDGLTRFDELQATARMLRARGHALSFVVTDSTSFVSSSGGDDLVARLRTVYAHGERRRFEELRAALGPTGVRVVLADASDSPALALSRTRASRGRTAA